MFKVVEPQTKNYFRATSENKVFNPSFASIVNFSYIKSSLLSFLFEFCCFYKVYLYFSCQIFLLKDYSTSTL